PTFSIGQPPILERHSDASRGGRFADAEPTGHDCYRDSVGTLRRELSDRFNGLPYFARYAIGRLVQRAHKPPDGGVVAQGCDQPPRSVALSACISDDRNIFDQG